MGLAARLISVDKNDGGLGNGPVGGGLGGGTSYMASADGDMRRGLGGNGDGTM